MRILLVEPDAATAASIELMLKSEGFNVYVTAEASEAIDLGAIYEYDIIITELALPDDSGYAVLRALRTAKVKTPVMVLTGMCGVEDKVKAFNLGCDDYLCKPFHKDEIVARIYAIVRRSRGHATPVLTVDGLTLDLDAKTVSVDGNLVHFTGREYQVLELLSLRQGKIITKEMILNHLYGGMDEPELKIIDVFICKIRKKLIAAAVDGRNLIETIWGRGYCLRASHVALPDLADKRGTGRYTRTSAIAEFAAA